MSGVAAVRYLLANNATLIAQVPATRILAGNLPIGVALPAIGVTQISGIQNLTVAMASGTRVMHTERIQVTVHAATYPTQKSILALVLAALPASRGTVNGVKVDSIIPDGVGPDLSQPDAGIFEQSRDFLVNWST